jgi:uncharacterized protein
MESGTSRRGFASMDPEKQREIARRGGRAAHEKGNAHEFSADEAREAGRKGGERVSADRSRMAEIGRRGGLISAARRAAKAVGRPGQQGSVDHTSPEESVPVRDEPRNSTWF